MIDIGIPQFFTAILLLSAAVVGLGILREELRERRLSKGVRRDVVRCRICGSVHRLEGRDVVQPCPRCGSFIRQGRDRRLG